MKQAALSFAILALAAGPAATQTLLRAPEFAPLIEGICLPLVRGGTVAAAEANARKLAFTATARNETMVTVERAPSLSITLGPGNCYIGLTAVTPPHFRAVEEELRAWLPRLGRYWAGRIEGEPVMGTRFRKYRAGGFTVTVEEQIDEYGRRINVNMGK
jgi:hypothetical protein